MRNRRFLVILGILLIVIAAFFVFTTSMSSEPVTIIAPASKATIINANSNHTISLWLLPGNKIYAYKGSNYKTGKKYDYTEIKDFLKQEKKTAGDSLFVIIGKSKYASYQNTVDILDEMTAGNIKNFALHEQKKRRRKPC